MVGQFKPGSTSFASQASDFDRGINQQADNTTISGGMQAVQGSDNVLNQGNNNLNIILHQYISGQLNSTDQLNFLVFGLTILASFQEASASSGISEKSMAESGTDCNSSSLSGEERRFLWEIFPCS